MLMWVFLLHANKSQNLTKLIPTIVKKQANPGSWFSLHATMVLLEWHAPLSKSPAGWPGKGSS